MQLLSTKLAFYTIQCATVILQCMQHFCCIVLESNNYKDMHFATTFCSAFTETFSGKYL